MPPVKKQPQIRMGGPGKIQRVAPTTKNPQGEYKPQYKKGVFTHKDREMEMGFIKDDDRKSRNKV